MLWNDDELEDCGGGESADLTFDLGVIAPTVSAIDLPQVVILAFAEAHLGVVIEASQLEYLTSEAKRGIVNCARQWGKSTLAAIKAIHRAWARPGSLVLVVSPTLRQSGLFLAKVRVLIGGTDWGRRLKKDANPPLVID